MGHNYVGHNYMALQNMCTGANMDMRTDVCYTHTHLSASMLCTHACLHTHVHTRKSGHNYMGHNYMGHNYIGHKSMGHNYYLQAKTDVAGALH